jgi:hypothetical protein
MIKHPQHRQWHGLAIICLSAILCVACGGPTSGPTAAASLELNISALDFGSVGVGKSKSKNIVLTNGSTTGTDVTVTQLSIDGAGFSLKNAATPFTLTAGQSSTITVVFSPKSGGTTQGTLSIMVDGSPDPAVASLAGSGLESNNLAVSPSQLSFGNVAVGDQKSLNGTLTAGTSDVNISTADWSGTGYTLSGITFPAAVAAGKSVSFTVTFAPQAAGSASGSVSFASNATNSPARVTLSGAGTQTQTGGDHSVVLSWQPSSSTVIGYNIYRATKTGGPYGKMNAVPEASTSFTDSSVLDGATYFYVATAVSSDAAESEYSGEVSATVPNP